MRRKLNPLRDAIAGKRLVVVDDSIVRGTTTRAMVRMLREAGAARSTCGSPPRPIAGRATTASTPGRASELIAANLEVGEIRDYLGADSLAYLELDALQKATGVPGAGFCDACLTGEYPVAVPVALSKAVLEPHTWLRGRHRTLDGLTYAGAGVDIDAGERAVERHQRPGPFDLPAGGDRRHRRLRRPVRGAEGLPTAGAGGVH